MKSLRQIRKYGQGAESRAMSTMLMMTKMFHKFVAVYIISRQNVQCTDRTKLNDISIMFSKISNSNFVKIAKLFIMHVMNIYIFQELFSILF